MAHEESSNSGSHGKLAVSYFALTKMSIAAYAAAEGYDEVFAKFSETMIADADMCDADGNATPADLEVLAIRDELIEYMKTTAGRHELAGSQIEQALIAYQDSDDAAKADIEQALEDLEAIGGAGGSHSWDAEEEASATDRPEEANEDLPSSYADYEHDLTGEGTGNG
jgi:hypothetical protein